MILKISENVTFALKSNILTMHFKVIDKKKMRMKKLNKA